MTDDWKARALEAERLLILRDLEIEQYKERTLNLRRALYGFLAQSGFDLVDLYEWTGKKLQEQNISSKK